MRLILSAAAIAVGLYLFASWGHKLGTRQTERRYQDALHSAHRAAQEMQRYAMKPVQEAEMWCRGCQWLGTFSEALPRNKTSARVCPECTHPVVSPILAEVFYGDMVKEARHAGR